MTTVEGWHATQTFGLPRRKRLSRSWGSRVATGFLALASTVAFATAVGDGLDHHTSDAARQQQAVPGQAGAGRDTAVVPAGAMTPVDTVSIELDLPDVAAASEPQPYPGSVEGLLTFRGNPTRSFYGSGPVPAQAAHDWSYPERAMCGLSTVGEETKQWCGTGWTGQPAVFERDGRTWVVFGAYDHAVHFVDARTGSDIIPPFPTGDIIKGSVTVDPDGYPIVYSGSRDGRYRAIAIDGPAPRELWALSAADATGPTMWNDDWDGAGLVLEDRLIVGGENSRVFVTQLNRGYDTDGRVSVDPEVLWDAPGWDEELLAAVGSNVSIESSVAMVGDTVYFTNSGGLVQGFDLAALDLDGEPERTFRWWIGDDADASVVADDEGMLYVAAEYERFNARSAEVGQMVKLDPTNPDDPVVWTFADPRAGSGEVAGVWATPALHRDLVIVNTTDGTSYGLDRTDGRIQWELDFSSPFWSSPLVVDDVLIQGDCEGVLHAFDLVAGTAPSPRWTIELGGCIESTPAVWNGRIYVGTRAGYMHAITAGTGVPAAG